MMKKNKKTRLLFATVLVFSFLVACKETSSEQPVTLQWEDGRATALVIPRVLLKDALNDSIPHLLQVHLVQNDSTAILGHYQATADKVIFTPLIPFTRGLEYQVRFREKQLYRVTIPAAGADEIPEVAMLYPDRDTFPGNQLKLYIAFSKPMQEGHALQNITLIKDERDTVRDAFLDLQPELWNHNNTILTVWFDPGRIKRDLQPNKQLGPPLEPGGHYRLLVDRAWKSASGAPLAKAYSKEFVVASRDSLSPDPAAWGMEIPAAGTTAALNIFFHEPLDYILATNAISVINATGEPVKGKMEIIAGAEAGHFIPDHKWMTGAYALLVEARLEDLAGNSLDHLFDTDLLRVKRKDPIGIFKRSFEVH